jgi:hypothetical protein
MTSFDRDKEEWTFRFAIGIVTHVKVDCNLDEADARSVAIKAIEANYADKTHDMQLGGTDWPINPTVTLLDPDERVEVVEL